MRNGNEFSKLTKYHYFFYFSPNPMEIKLISMPIKESIYDFAIQLGSVVTKMLQRQRALSSLLFP